MKIPKSSSLQSALPLKWCPCEILTAAWQEANTEQFQIDKKAKRLGKTVGGKQQRTENSKISTSLKSLKYFWVKNPAFKHQLQLSAPSSALYTVTFTYPILQKVSLKVCSGCFVFHLLDSKMAVKRQCKWTYCYITYNKK